MERYYSHDKKAFLIKDGENDAAVVPFSFSDLNNHGDVLNEANLAQFDYKICYKKDVPELDYHFVKINIGVDGGHPIRLGWMIPIATLTTDDADTLAKQYLNEYIFWAYCFLLSLEPIQNELGSDKSLSEVLEEKYPDGCIFIVEKSQMPAGKSIKHCELSLARNGYFFSRSNYLNPQIELKLDDLLVLSPAGEILGLDGRYVNQYIEEFLEKYTYDTNSFIRFFYLYQIVEVLLDKELIEVLRDLANKIENNEATYKTADNALQDNGTEIKRFERFVNNSKIKVNQYIELDQACNDFLGSKPDRQLKNPESVYQVRNHIVHRFRKATADAVAVNKICDLLELYLYDLLIKYKLPDVNRA